MSAVSHWKTRKLLLIATAIVVICMFVPFGHLVTYPLRLFNTFIHETGHALATFATGGTVLGMEVNLDTSGLAKRRGGFGPIVASAGYLASIFMGALLLYAGRYRRWAPTTLMSLGAGTLLATVFFAGYGSSLLAFAGFTVGCALVLGAQTRFKEKKHAQRGLNAVGGLLIAAALAYIWMIGGLLTSLIGLGMGGALILIALYANRFIQHLAVLFLGVQISLDGLHSVRTLWRISTQHTHISNDAQSMADYTGIPAPFWALLWGALGLAVIAWAFWLFWQQDKKGKTSR